MKLFSISLSNQSSEIDIYCRTASQVWIQAVRGRQRPAGCKAQSWNQSNHHQKYEDWNEALRQRSSADQVGRRRLIHNQMGDQSGPQGRSQGLNLVLIRRDKEPSRHMEEFLPCQAR